MTHLPTQLARKLINTTNARGLLAVAICGAATLAITPASALAQDDNASFWTQFAPSEDTRLIFVSSSEGNDNNSGLTPAEPVASLDKAYDLLRDGYPDWMLLKRGDAWYSSMPSWGKSGRSETEKMLVGAYGTESQRPEVRPEPTQKGMQASGGGHVAHVAFIGFHLEPQERQASEGAPGIRWLIDSKDIHFEDLYVSGFKDNMILQAVGDGVFLRDFYVNGCVVVDSWSNSGHAQGLFASGVDGLTIENSVFDHNGWNLDKGAEPTIFNHNLYIQHFNLDVTIRDNIIGNGSSHGVQLRSNGVLDSNFFYANPISILVSSGSDDISSNTRGVVTNNLIMNGRDISESLPRGWGMEIKYSPNSLIDGNIIAYSENSSNTTPFLTNPTVNYHGPSNIVFSNNKILGWEGGVSINPPHDDGLSQATIYVESNILYRDMAYNSPLVNISATRDLSFAFSQNSYIQINPIDDPFRVQNQWLSPTTWQDDYESTATVSTALSVPDTLNLGHYLQSHGLGDNADQVIELARQLSRNNTNPAITASNLIGWAHTQFPDD